MVGRDLPVEARRSSEVVPPPEIGGLKYKESVSAFLDQIVKDRQAKSIANVGRDISIDEFLRLQVITTLSLSSGRWPTKNLRKL